jgi:DEAD/DEAH box helicase domain-containing protein
VNVDEERPQPVIQLKPVDHDYYTRTQNKVNVLDADSEETRDINGFTLHFGRGTVLVHYHSYDQMYISNSEPKQQMLATETPPILMDTQLCWVEVPDDVENALVRKYQDYGLETGVDPDETGMAHLGYVAGLHAAEHATIQTAPLELRVDKDDLGGLATLVMDTHYTHNEYDEITDSIGESFEAAKHALEQRTQELGGRTCSGWFIYDGVEGGLGFARAIYDNFEALCERARDQLENCQCGQPNGCPACTFDENCGNDNKPLLRQSAVDVLNQLLGDADREDLSEYLPDDEYGGNRRPVVFYS